MNTSRNGFSQSTCTACEMHPTSARERCTCSRLSLRTSSNESCRAVTLTVTTIISCPRFLISDLISSWRSVGRIGQFTQLLRPALQRGASGVGEQVDSALGPIEPAIDIVQQDFRCVGNFRLEVAHPL